MSAFAAAVDTFFKDPNLGLDATYTPQGGSGIAVRLIRVQPQDVQIAIGGLQIVSSGNVFAVRQSEIPNPAEGDTFAVGDTIYTVQGAPKLDQVKGTWQVETYKS